MKTKTQAKRLAELESALALALSRIAALEARILTLEIRATRTVPYYTCPPFDRIDDAIVCGLGGHHQ